MRVIEHKNECCFLVVYQKCIYVCMNDSSYMTLYIHKYVAGPLQGHNGCPLFALLETTNHGTAFFFTHVTGGKVVKFVVENSTT